MDLELATGPITRPQVLLWVEVKVDAPLSGYDQLQRYEQALIERPGDVRKLVLLDQNAEDLPHRAQPRYLELVRATWQTVAEVALSTREAGANGWRASAELLSFLEEGDLAMTSPVTTLDVLLVEQRRLSDQRWKILLASAAEHLAQRLQESDVVFEAVRAEPRNWAPRFALPSYWLTFPRPGEMDWQTAWCEWTMRPLTDHSSFYFGAGITAHMHGELVTQEAEAHFRASDLSVKELDRLLRIFRWQPVSALLTAASLEDQAAEVAGWASEAVLAAVRAFETRPRSIGESG